MTMSAKIDWLALIGFVKILAKSHILLVVLQLSALLHPTGQFANAPPNGQEIHSVNVLNVSDQSSQLWCNYFSKKACFQMNVKPTRIVHLTRHALTMSAKTLANFLHVEPELYASQNITLQCVSALLACKEIPLSNALKLDVNLMMTAVTMKDVSGVPENASLYVLDKCALRVPTVKRQTIEKYVHALRH